VSIKDAGSIGKADLTASARASRPRVIHTPEDDAADGRIDVTIRVGVTGHRALSDVDSIRTDVREALELLRGALPFVGSSQTRLKWRVISALAEGADQLVAHELLHAGASLDVVLPLEVDDYREDFVTPALQKEFEHLRRKARREIVMPPAATRNEAYLRCGQDVVRRSDVVIAIWDGEEAHGEGGTGDIVHFAQDLLIPIIWIPTDGKRRIVPMKGTEPVEWADLAPFSNEVVKNLDEYNGSVAAEKLETTADAWRGQLERLNKDSLDIETICDWIAPNYARAELRANRAESLFKSIETSLFLLSFLAVSIVAAQLTLWSREKAMVWGEIACLIAVGAGFIWAHRRNLQERWVSARFLGEAFRSATFLAMAGIGDQSEWAEAQDPDDDDVQEMWLRRAFAEVWDSRPNNLPMDSDVGPLQRFLASAWIDDQARYHQRTAAKHGRRKSQFQSLAGLLFLFSILVAVGHIVTRSPHENGREWWGFVAIVIPAAAAAASGLAGQREYHLHFKRYQRMARRLGRLRTKMQTAPDLTTIQAIALETERLIRDEQGQWIGVVQLHELELPS
jgi:hypothetical protein